VQTLTGTWPWNVVACSKGMCPAVKKIGWETRDVARTRTKTLTTDTI